MTSRRIRPRLRIGDGRALPGAVALVLVTRLVALEVLALVRSELDGKESVTLEALASLGGKVLLEFDIDDSGRGLGADCRRLRVRSDLVGPVFRSSTGLFYKVPVGIIRSVKILGPTSASLVLT